MPALEPPRRPRSRSSAGLAAGVALLLLIGAAAGLSALREDTDRLGVRSPDARTREASGTGQAGRATKPALSGPIAVPAGVLAVHDHGTELALIETATGKQLRTLVDLGPYPGGGTEEEQQFFPAIDGLTVTPDGQWAYYSVGPEPAVGQLFRVSTRGGKPESLGDGDQPTVSPDGRLLAHRSLQAVVVRDLISGKTRRWEADAEFTESPMRLAWTPDSRLLAVETSSSPRSSAVRVLDVSRPQPLMDAQPLRSPLSGPESPSYRAFDGLLGVIASGPQGAGTRFAVLDPASGRVVGAIDLTFTAFSAVYDASGRHQLFVADDGALYRRSGGPMTRLPVADVSLAAWSPAATR